MVFVGWSTYLTWINIINILYNCHKIVSHPSPPVFSFFGEFSEHENFVGFWDSFSPFLELKNDHIQENFFHH